MFSKLVAFIMTFIMFFSSALPGFFRDLGLGGRAEELSETIAAYVEEKLPFFKDILTSMGEAFGAGSIDYVKDCTLIDENGNEKEAAYVDFNGNFGYMVITKDYFVAAYKSEGDHPEFKDIQGLVYSTVDGFGSRNADGSVDYLVEPDTTFNYEYFIELFKYASEDGELSDSDAYIGKQYGDGYTMTAEYELPDFDYTLQMDTSVYRLHTVQNGMHYQTSEGNCGINAMYTFLSYLKKKAGDTTDAVYSRLPGLNDKVKVYASDDPFFAEKYKDKAYSAYGNPDGEYYVMGYNYNTRTHTWVDSGFDLPETYSFMRNIYINEYGYTDDSVNTGTYGRLFDLVFKKYGIEGKKLKTYEDFKTFYTLVVPHLKNGYPVLWSMNNSSTYHAHTTVITGYKVYTKFIEKNGMTFATDTVVLFKLNDNWNAAGSYFDYTRYHILDGGFYTVDN